MSVSEKQLAANRQNAQKSTGPRTPEGKAKVCLNAVKHGLYSRRPLITCPRLPENQTDYDNLLGVLTAKLAPNSTVEHFLVRRIANCAWQLRRSDRFAALHLLAKMRDLLDSANPALRAIAKLYHRLLVFNRRLRHRIDRLHSLLLGVKQSHFTDMVQQLAEAIDEFSNRCQTNPLIERVL
jgi:hypothetical protein